MMLIPNVANNSSANNRQYGGESSQNSVQKRIADSKTSILHMRTYPE